MSEYDYEELGLVAGLEIHQQLDTATKLFCSCPTELREPEASVRSFERYLHPTKSELGEIDDAALEESQVERTFEYLAYDTTCLVYFAFYQGQRGWTRADSHRGDREPLYLFLDQYGTVTEVVYSAWHWMQAASSSPHLYEPDGGGTHVTARTFEPHHQYKLTDENAGRLLSVNELGTSDDAPFTADLNSDVQFEQWLAEGWSEALHPGAATEPWIMRNRDSWWRDGTERYARAVWNVQLQLAQFGLDSLAGEASNTDLADQ